MSSFNKKKKKFSDTLGSKQKSQYSRPDFEKMYKHLIERVKGGVYIADEQGYVFYVNHALVEILGYSMKSELMEAKLLDLLYGYPDAETELYDQMEEKGFVKDYEITHKNKGGKVLTLSVTSNFICHDNGKIKGLEGIVHDITEQKKMKESIITEKFKLEQILGLSEKINVLRDLEGLLNFIVQKTSGILEAKRCSIMLLDEKGFELRIVAAVGLDEEIIKETKVVLGDDIAGKIAQKREPVLVKNIEYDEAFKRGNRPYYLSRSFICVPILLDDELMGIINVSDKRADPKNENPFNEIDLRILSLIAREAGAAISNAQIINNLNLQTVTDPLTRIFNYRKFSDSLEHEINRVKRMKGDLCVMMLDLDNFKSYNDTFGHLEGDILLRGIGTILKESLRDTDIVCRYAGDEFVIVLPDTNIEGVRKSAEKVIYNVENYKFKRKVTMSLGAAKYEDGQTANEVMLKADKALYEAKHKGKNQFFILE